MNIPACGQHGRRTEHTEEVPTDGHQDRPSGAEPAFGEPDKQGEPARHEDVVGRDQCEERTEGQRVPAPVGEGRETERHVAIDRQGLDPCPQGAAEHRSNDHDQHDCGGERHPPQQECADRPPAGPASGARSRRHAPSTRRVRLPVGPVGHRHASPLETCLCQLLTTDRPALHRAKRQRPRHCGRSRRRSVRRRSGLPALAAGRGRVVTLVPWRFLDPGGGHDGSGGDRGAALVHRPVAQRLAQLGRGQHSGQVDT